MNIRVEVYDKYYQIDSRKKELAKEGFDVGDNRAIYGKLAIFLLCRDFFKQDIRKIDADMICFQCGYYEDELEEAMQRVVPRGGYIFQFGAQVWPKKKVEL